jgi:ParB-like chromosome segregation protein Spo0J
MNLSIEYIPPSALTAYSKNARMHSDEQIEQLCRSIQQFGFNVPVLANADGQIIAGHGRVMAANRSGLEQIPVIRIEHLTEDQVRAYVIADNKIALNAGWDFELLSSELSDLAEAGFDLELTGFDEQELDGLLAEVSAIIPDDRWQNELLPVAPVDQVSVRPSSEPVQEALSQEQDKPSASGDRYSNFEILMIHHNKVELVEKLSKVRSMYGYPKLEDALMHVVRAFDEE